MAHRYYPRAAARARGLPGRTRTRAVDSGRNRPSDVRLTPDIEVPAQPCTRLDASPHSPSVACWQSAWPPVRPARNPAGRSRRRRPRRSRRRSRRAPRRHRPRRAAPRRPRPRRRPCARPAAPSGAPSGGTGTVLTEVASGVNFQTTSFQAPASQPFQIAFDNQDASIPHNIQIADGSGAFVFEGDTVTGVNQITYDVPALAAGQYKFSCKWHPNMVGDLTVQ